MINKKLVAAFCLGLMSSVAWCNLQTLVTSRGLAHIAGTAASAGLTVFFGSPIWRHFILGQEGKQIDKETYFVAFFLALRAKGIHIKKQGVAQALVGIGCVGGLGLSLYMGNEVRKVLQHTEEASVTK